MALLLSGDDPNGRQGFVRVINHSDAAGEVSVRARDDAGAERGSDACCTHDATAVEGLELSEGS